MIARVSLRGYHRLRDWIAQLTDYERESGRAVPYDPAHYNLDRMDRLCERLGRPEQAYPIAHVGGTKGKGSTVSMIAACLAAAGRRVGVYTSPHLVHLGERVAVGGRAATAEELGAAFEAIEPALAAAHAEGERFTFFEVMTALAFERFRRERVGAAVVEVGLGGRLDSTNVVRPAVAAITSVGLDHTDKLGTTIPAIAREKAGILKPGVPAVLGPLSPDALAVVRAEARARGAAPVFAAPDDLGAEGASASEEGTSIARLRVPGRAPLAGVRLRLVGRHMAQNAAVAAAAALLVDPALPESALRRGLAEAWIDGRFQIFRGGRWRGAPTIVVDGAHNPGAIDALVAAIAEVYPGARPAVVFGALRDKDVPGMLARLFPLASALVAAPCNSPREVPPAAICDLAAAAGISPAEPAASAAEALASAARRAGAEGLVLVCGSLYLAGAALAELRRT